MPPGMASPVARRDDLGGERSWSRQHVPVYDPPVKIPKPSAEDKARFESLVPRDARVEVKPMFGNLGAFVNGNMFMGLFGSDVGVKLDASHSGELSKAGGGPFGPSERPMGGYLSLPATLSDAEARTWAAAALAYVSALPSKAKKPAI